MNVFKIVMMVRWLLTCVAATNQFRGVNWADKRDIFRLGSSCAFGVIAFGYL